MAIAGKSPCLIEDTSTSWLLFHCHASLQGCFCSVFQVSPYRSFYTWMYHKNWGIYSDLLFLKAFIDLRGQLQGLLTLPQFYQHLKQQKHHETNERNINIMAQIADICWCSICERFLHVIIDWIHCKHWESTRGLKPDHHLSPHITSASVFVAGNPISGRGAAVTFFP